MLHVSVYIELVEPEIRGKDKGKEFGGQTARVLVWVWVFDIQVLVLV